MGGGGGATKTKIEKEITLFLNCTFSRRIVFILRYAQLLSAVTEKQCQLELGLRKSLSVAIALLNVHVQYCTIVYITRKTEPM